MLSLSSIRDDDASLFFAQMLAVLCSLFVLGLIGILSFFILVFSPCYLGNAFLEGFNGRDTLREVAMRFQ